jgi:hypothetical protein
LDFSGLTLALEGEASSASAPGIHGTLRLRTHADRSEAEEVLRHALELCPVGRIFREAHVPVHVVVAVSPAERSG